MGRSLCNKCSVCVCGLNSLHLLPLLTDTAESHTPALSDDCLSPSDLLLNVCWKKIEQKHSFLLKTWVPRCLIGKNCTFLHRCIVLLISRKFSNWKMNVHTAFSVFMRFVDNKKNLKLLWGFYSQTVFQLVLLPHGAFVLQLPGSTEKWKSSFNDFKT